MEPIDRGEHRRETEKPITSPLETRIVFFRILLHYHCLLLSLVSLRSILLFDAMQVNFFSILLKLVSSFRREIDASQDFDRIFDRKLPPFFFFSLEKEVEEMLSRVKLVFSQQPYRARGNPRIR